MSYIIIEMGTHELACICKESPEYGSGVKFFSFRKEAQKLADKCKDGIVVNLNVETPEDTIIRLIRSYQETGLTDDEVRDELEILVATREYY